jgi:hypothetical protein
MALKSRVSRVLEGQVTELMRTIVRVAAGRRPITPSRHPRNFPDSSNNRSIIGFRLDNHGVVSQPYARFAFCTFSLCGQIAPLESQVTEQCYGICVSRSASHLLAMLSVLLVRLHSRGN